MDEVRASVEAALEMLQEEIAALVHAARQEGAEAYLRGDARAFARLDNQRAEYAAFAERVDAIVAQWRTLSGGGRRRRTRESPDPSPVRWLPEKEYVLPILQVLHEAGGAASIQDVRRRLEELLGPRFGPGDREILADGELRWENRMRWVRFALVRDGLMPRSRKQGIWEIAPEGEALLRAGNIDAVWPRIQRAKNAPR